MPILLQTTKRSKVQTRGEGTTKLSALGAHARWHLVGANRQASRQTGESWRVASASAVARARAAKRGRGGEGCPLPAARCCVSSGGACAWLIGCCGVVFERCTSSELWRWWDW